jgi:hypothetical protein
MSLAVVSVTDHTYVGPMYYKFMIASNYKSEPDRVYMTFLIYVMTCVGGRNVAPTAETMTTPEPVAAAV